MGIGTERSEWDEYEWFPSGGGPDGQPDPQEPSALADRVVGLLPWEPGDAPRILLVDLDNLRAGPVRWKERMAVVVALARTAHHVALAGQDGPVGRALPHLAEFAATAQRVPAGSDLADFALLALIDRLDIPDAQTLVMSNDGIFAELAHCGPLLVLSPGADAMSDALARAATRVVDLAEVERDLAAPAARRR